MTKTDELQSLVEKLLLGRRVTSFSYKVTGCCPHDSPAMPSREKLSECAELTIALEPK